MKSLLLVAALVSGLSAAAAQEAAPAAKPLTLELNGARPSEKGCRFGFVVTNGFDTALDKLGYEIVLFDKGGAVKRMLVLDFGAMPAGKTRVREFDLASIDCGEIGSVLVNDASACAGAGVEGRCLSDLALSSRAPIRFEL
ncbi:hypothetical protein [Aurantimonas sp. Leaf443]|uniref:hypothetical protein n=1 Tax=Aurantimonas sp. Leaf443 TaxID=1736378 RepID=UPI000AD3AAD9|nr:hypothetical protein [Aurantimonas sp. Leaf443]